MSACFANTIQPAVIFFNLLVIDVISGVASLSQVDVTVIVLCQSGVCVYRCAISNNQTSQRIVHLHTVIFTFVSKFMPHFVLVGVLLCAKYITVFFSFL